MFIKSMFDFLREFVPNNFVFGLLSFAYVFLMVFVATMVVLTIVKVIGHILDALPFV